MLTLDIGAGNTQFAKELKKLNPQIRTFLCGDPIFQKQEYDFSKNIFSHIEVFLSRFSHILSQTQIVSVIEEAKTGVFKILATYQNIPLPDNCVDIVTLNSPHPLMFPGKAGFEEFRRVLKKGGIFYFGHSKHIGLDLPLDDFEFLGEGEFYYGGKNIASLPDYGLKFPMSPVMKSNLIALRMMERGLMKNSSSYIYGNGPGKIPLHPSWKAWMKI